VPKYSFEADNLAGAKLNVRQQELGRCGLATRARSPPRSATGPAQFGQGLRKAATRPLLPAQPWRGNRGSSRIVAWPHCSTLLRNPPVIVYFNPEGIKGRRSQLFEQQFFGKAAGKP